VYLLTKHRGVKFPEGRAWWDTWNAPDQFTTQEDRNWAWSEGLKLGLFRYGHIVKGAVDGVRELAKLGDIQVVTHRPKQAARDTFAFLAYVDFPIAGVTVTQGPKSEVGCDVYIDDGPHVIEELESAGKEVVVFDRPYNRGPWLSDATRAYTWDDVPRLVGEVLS
jgi:5'(3')-deoxyribonucleotidase